MHLAVSLAASVQMFSENSLAVDTLQRDIVYVHYITIIYITITISSFWVTLLHRYTSKDNVYLDRSKSVEARFQTLCSAHPAL